MTPRVATVLSARDWEPGLVDHARRSAALRVVLRAFQPDEIERRVDGIDVVVAGAEVPWVTPVQIAAWRRMGLRVVGIHPVGDRPAAEMLAAAGADEILSDDLPIEVIAQTLRFLAPAPRRPTTGVRGEILAVVGPRGAPGCTELALAIAWEQARRRPTMLLDLDREAPALAIRLGLAPRPDVTDAADAVRATGDIPQDAVHRLGPLQVVVGSHRPAEPALRPALAEEVLEAAALAVDLVVADLGMLTDDDRLLKRADRAVLVVDAGAVGVVRAARVVAEWSGPPPELVVNRAPAGEAGQLRDAVRRWTGLDPVAVLPDRLRVRRAALAARPPDRALRRLLVRAGMAR